MGEGHIVLKATRLIEWPTAIPYVKPETQTGTVNFVSFLTIPISRIVICVMRKWPAYRFAVLPSF